jgi:hypothetical protein
MYLDNNGEFVCIQCGCSCFPEAVTKIPAAAKEKSKPENNLFADISIALRVQRSGQVPDSVSTKASVKS